MELVNLFLPNIKKNDVLNDIHITSDEINESVIPGYTAAADFFGSFSLKSKSVLTLQDMFYRTFDKSSKKKKSNFILEIEEVIPLMKTNLDFLKKQVEHELAKDTLSEGSSLKVKTLIRASEHLSFLSRFSIDLLSYVYSEEALACNADVSDSVRMAPAAKKHIETNITKFGFLIGKYGRDSTDFQHLLNKIPKIVVTKDNAASVTELYSDDQLDPLAIGVWADGFTYNPIFHFRLLINEWEDARYKRNQQRKREQELRIMHLRLLQENKNDPKIEKEIAYRTKLVDDLTIWLREKEEDAGLSYE